MTSAGEIFVVQLARASRKANRLVRYLPEADRDDIIAAALLWCWEHRESHSLTTSLDTWFINAVRDAYKKWTRGEQHSGAESLRDIPTGDTTLATVEAHEVATKLAAALPAAYREVARLHVYGYSRAEMETRGITKATIDAARARIRQLRRLLPEEHQYRRVILTTAYGDSDSAAFPRSAIDQEIEQLEAMPRHGADCPPCWKCKWFEGYLPGAHKRLGMAIQEPEVKEAVASIERRKVEIAKSVRQHTLNYLRSD